MIRDRLVVGIRDITLSEQLQTNAELTLDKAKKIIRQREAVHQQQCLLKGRELQSIEALQHGSYRGNWRQGKTKSKGQPFTGKKCTRCGIHMTNALPRMPSATAAKRKVTMEICAFPRPRQIQSKQRLNPWTLHSWTT